MVGIGDGDLWVVEDDGQWCMVWVLMYVGLVCSVVVSDVVGVSGFVQQWVVLGCIVCDEQ